MVGHLQLLVGWAFEVRLELGCGCVNAGCAKSSDAGRRDIGWLER